MYVNGSRNKYRVRQFGHSWPHNGQPTYQQFTYNYTPYANYPIMYDQIPIQQNFPTGFQPYSPYPTPYPIPSAGGFPPQQQPKAVQGILSQFKKKDGTYDINKLMDTAGQMMGAVNQVNSIVKGLTKTFKV